MKKTILILIIVGLFISGASFFYLKKKWEAPGCQYQELITQVKISPNTPLNKIIQILTQHKIIQHPLLFKLGAMLFGQNQTLKAGLYNLSPCWSYKKIFEILSQGKELLQPVCIPEGLPWWKVAQIYSRHGLISKAKFYQAFTDPNLLHKFHIPAKNAEGYLFPSTYFFSQTKKYSGYEIVSLMLKTFQQETKKLFESYSPQKIHRFVILASIIEKETSLKKEKPIIAGVFINRLHKHMLLQSDPTVIYGLGEKFNGNLTKKDLKNSNNIYNTYTHKGLPPGPICSPGLDSLKAAVFPQKNNYLYFVSKGNGSHYFSKTLKDHLKAVRKYQLKK
ncbi:MAG: endolytic transglycosylase MltG [Desulfonauticus sp.]|nr:endolytic transglycosylase MltG [Desulfonauticus sp.]